MHGQAERQSVRAGQRRPRWRGQGWQATPRAAADEARMRQMAVPRADPAVAPRVAHHPAAPPALPALLLTRHRTHLAQSPQAARGRCAAAGPGPGHPRRLQAGGAAKAATAGGWPGHGSKSKAQRQLQVCSSGRQAIRQAGMQTNRVWPLAEAAAHSPWSPARAARSVARWRSTS